MRQWLPGGGYRPVGGGLVVVDEVRGEFGAQRGADLRGGRGRGDGGLDLVPGRAVHVRRGHRVDRPEVAVAQLPAGDAAGRRQHRAGRVGGGAGWGVGMAGLLAVTVGLSGRAGGCSPGPGPGLELGQSAAMRSNARVLIWCTPVLVTTRSARAIAGFRLSAIGATWSVYSVMAW